MKKLSLKILNWLKIKVKIISQNLKLEYNKGMNIETFYGDIINDTFRDPNFTSLYYIDSSDQDYLKIFFDCPRNIYYKRCRW